MEVMSQAIHDAITDVGAAMLGLRGAGRQCPVPSRLHRFAWLLYSANPTANSTKDRLLVVTGQLKRQPKRRSEEGLDFDTSIGIVFFPSRLECGQMTGDQEACCATKV